MWRLYLQRVWMLQHKAAFEVLWLLQIVIILQFATLPATQATTMLSIYKTALALLLAIATASTGKSDADVAGNLRRESRNLATTYSTTTQYAALMLAQVNAQRAAQGLSPLCINTKLMAAAKRHSSDMAAKNFMSHTGSDGSTMSGRVTVAGYKWSRVAENVAAGQMNVAAVMTSWMNSPGHKANILGAYTHIGFAYAYSSSSTYKHYWTQDFGKSTVETCNYNYEDAEYIDTPTLNTTDFANNSTVVFLDEPTPVNATTPDSTISL